MADYVVKNASCPESVVFADPRRGAFCGLGLHCNSGREIIQIFCTGVRNQILNLIDKD